MRLNWNFRVSEGLKKYPFHRGGIHDIFWNYMSVLYFFYKCNTHSSSTHITLQCDPHEEGRLKSLEDPLKDPVVDNLQVVSSMGNLLRRILMNSEKIFQ